MYCMMYCRFLLIVDFNVIAVVLKLKPHHIILNTCSCFLLVQIITCHKISRFEPVPFIFLRSIITDFLDLKTGFLDLKRFIRSKKIF